MEVCEICGKSCALKCSGCSLKFYCSKEHQKVDWKRGHKGECICYEIKENDALGRYMIAKRDIKAGEIILRENPCIVGPKITSLPMCLGCHKTIAPPAFDFYKCSKCSWPMCGESCETLESHIEECKVMTGKAFKSPIKFSQSLKIESSYCVIVPLRVILLKFSDPKAYETVMSLVSHLDQRIHTKLYGALRVNLVPFIRDFLKISEYSEKEILNIAGILDTNCFDIVLPATHIRGRGIYPLTAMMAHECVPNTKHFVDGNLEMKVIACETIKRGEMILTSYTHPLKTTMERRHQLKEAKCFDCVCPRCKDPTEMGTFASSIRCLECPSGILISSDPLESFADWQCKSCHVKFPANRIVPVLSKARACLEALNKKSIDDCERFLMQFDGILPPLSVFNIDVKFSLCLLYGNVGDPTPHQLKRKQELCTEVSDAINNLEPGISNSSMNVKFELATAKIAQIKQRVRASSLTKADGEEFIARELNDARQAFDILSACCEAKLLLEDRMKRIIEQSSL